MGHQQAPGPFTAGGMNFQVYLGIAQDKRKFAKDSNAMMDKQA